MKKFISIVVCLAIIIGIAAGCAAPAQVLTTQNNLEHSRSVYIDGVKYTVRTDGSFNTIVEAQGDGCDAEMIIRQDGSGTAVINNYGQETQIFDLQVNNLSQDNVDVNVFVNGELVERFNDVESLAEDLYTEQSATALVMGGIVITISLKALVTVLLKVALTIVVASTTYYLASAAVDAIKKSTKLLNQYFNAYRKGDWVYISGKTISKSQATARVKLGGDIYSYYSSNVRSAFIATGLGAFDDGHHKKWYSVGIYFRHYHTLNRNGAHGFYGLPV